MTYAHVQSKQRVSAKVARTVKNGASGSGYSVLAQRSPKYETYACCKTQKKRNYSFSEISVAHKALHHAKASKAKVIIYSEV